MKHFAICTLLALFCFGTQRAPAFSFDSSSEVPIYATTQPDMFPQQWQQYDVFAEPLAPDEAERARGIVKLALAKYPSALLRKNLKAVYIVGDLKFRGISAGGTNSRDKVYVTDKGETKGYSERHFEKIFHAELSSILLRNYTHQFPTAEWLAANPPSFQYGGDGVQAVKDGMASTRVTSKFATDGFVSQYAQASMEEDFNQVAGWLFVGEPSIWELGGRYPRVAEKIALAIKFYQSLDPALNQRHFEELYERLARPHNLLPTQGTSPYHPK